jgi:ubiquinone/menaquinone biosynthesis C-methylase UbiE
MEDHGINTEKREKSDEHFNKWARSYDRSFLQNIFFGPIQKKVIECAKKYVKDPSEILDIGCGTGQLLRKIASAYPGAVLTGIDAAEEMIKNAKSATPSDNRVHFINGIAEKLPFPDGKFDLAFTTMSFHHWADQASGLKEVNRVLRKGGIFVFADHIREGVFWFVGSGGIKESGSFMVMNFNELNTAFNSSSFNCEEHHSIFGTKALQVIVCRKN